MTLQRPFWVVPWLLAGALGAMGCSMSDASSGGSLAEPPGAGGFGGNSAGATGGGINVDTGGGNGGASGGGATTGMDNLPPEQEAMSSFRAPVATEHYVWAANPVSGRVSLIDPKTLGVKTIEAGNGPTFLAAVPANGKPDRALVINVLSRDATILEKAGDAAPSATRVDLSDGCNSWTPTGCNAWAISPDGRWAVAWTEASEVTSPNASDGFQEISIVDLDAASPSAATLAVGYRPSQIAFASGRAYAVTSDGVSIVDLESATVLRTVKLDPDAAVDPTDVSITPDGAYAIARKDSSASVFVVGLDAAPDAGDRSRTTYVLNGVVTDVDLSDQGDRAVAVARAASQVAVLPVPAPSPAGDDAGGAAQVPSFTLHDTVVGSVELTPGGKAALLFTNAVPLEYLTYLPLDAPDARRTIVVHSPIESVSVTPDGQHAIVLHNTAVDGLTQLPDAGATLDGAAAQIPATAKVTLGAFSLVPLLKENPPRIQSTLEPIMDRGVAMSPSGDHVLFATRDDKTRGYHVYVADLPSLQVTKFDLASPPLAVGVVASPPRGFVAQDNADGRITIIDLDQHTARTLTGFELNANIVEGVSSMSDVDGGTP